MPAGASTHCREPATARYVQRPLRVNRLPPTEAVGFGPTVGDEVTMTNAAAWHNAGITGNVTGRDHRLLRSQRLEHE